MPVTIINQFEDFKVKLASSIQREDLPNLISIYVIGSFACGKVERKHSDIDLYFVIKANSVAQRIATIRRIDTFINPFLHRYISELYNLDETENPEYHPHHYFTRSEFEHYCNLYPTRVLYPFLNGDWKLAYGVDCLSDFQIPSRASCVECLQYDYDGLIEFFQELEFNGDSRALVKYFYRAIKKAAWILFNTYIPSYLDVPTLIPLFAKTYPDVASTLRLTEEFASSNYEMNGMQYLCLYMKINHCYEFLGKEINKYVLNNGYNLIDPEYFYRRQFWGTFYIEFEEIVRKYLNEEKLSAKLSILTQDYQKLLSLICYVSLYDYPLDSILISKEHIPPKRSRILNSKTIRFDLMALLLKKDQFTFLINEHAALIKSGALKRIKSSDLDDYIEHQYLPAIYDVLKFIEHIKGSIPNSV